MGCLSRLELKKKGGGVGEGGRRRVAGGMKKVCFSISANDETEIACAWIFPACVSKGCVCVHLSLCLSSERDNLFWELILKPASSKFNPRQREA